MTTGPVADSLSIVIALFPGVTHLDFTGPHQFFARVPKAKLQVASLGGHDIEADGLVFSELGTLEDIGRCDLFCVPGGYGTAMAIHNRDFLGQIQRLGASARYLTSVCSGSIILAAAGLLTGKQAACHWAWRDMLAQFPGVRVKPDRVVRDGNTFTGGGVTAGIDMALTVIAELLGEQQAQAIQLGLEYDPQPPFKGGRPETSPDDIVANVKARLDKAMVDNRALVAQFLQHQQQNQNQNT